MKFRTTKRWEAEQRPDIIIKVREAQVRHLFRQTWRSQAGSLLVAICVCIILWKVISPWKLLLWMAVLSLTNVVRIAHVVAFKKKTPSGHAIYMWARLHAIGASAGALLWGLPSILLWPQNSPLHQMVWPICMVAISAAAVIMFCTWTPSYVPFLILTMIPISGRLLFEGGLVFVVLGLLGLLFTAILAQTGRAMHATSLHSFKVGFRNEALSAFLADEKSKAEALNVQLQQEIEERRQSQNKLQKQNLELEKVNTQLTNTKDSLKLANKELEIALKNVKQLSGMLPICSSCKKIRNDKGYWEQIEAFIKDHSEAEFSHGICPECAKELYPKMFDKK
jgi:hypothetical protein